MNESIAYALGLDAFHEGDALTTNPYDPTDVEYREWLDGWYHAAGMLEDSDMPDDGA